MIDFTETWNELDEIYKADFNSINTNNFYHFYADPHDLLNSLITGRMYSNKNARASQLDIYAYNTKDDITKNYAYVCMTTGKDGKERAIKHLKRPLGISFKNLEDLCSRKKYDFNPNKEYSQFAEKTQYNLTKSKSGGEATRYSSDKMIDGFRDFRILAIGALGGNYEGTYFISGGQGRNLNNHWHSKLFTDESLYKILYSWFEANMNSDMKHAYYLFKNDTIGKPLENSGHIYTDKKGNKRAINTDQQLNPNYVPWADLDKNKNKTDFHEMAMAFELVKGDDVKFKEIIGVGPLLVETEEGEILLKMDMVQSGSKGGYQAPCIFSTNSATNTYANETNIAFGQPSRDKNSKGLRQQNLMLDKNTAESIYQLYSETEYRVYIPQKRDFVFTPQDIETLVLPNYFNNSDIEINIAEIVDSLCKQHYNLPTNKIEAVEQLKADGFIFTSKEGINDNSYDLVKDLINLLQSKYKHTTVEILEVQHLPNTKKAKITAYQRDNNTSDVLPMPDKNGEFPGADKTRYLVNTTDQTVNANNIYPDLSRATVKYWDNIPSIVAPIIISGEEQSARLGAETIVIGTDEDNNKYVLFVNNAHKTEGFFELPGGGLYEIPTDDSAFKKIAEHRLHFKGGITIDNLKNNLDGLVDTNKALLLHEKAVAKDKGVVWQWSYYRLFKAHYNKVINFDDIDYFFNNEHMERVEGEDGYTCYLRWIPVDTLNHNRSIVSRYSNIINDIQAEAKRF